MKNLYLWIILFLIIILIITYISLFIYINRIKKSTCPKRTTTCPICPKPTNYPDSTICPKPTNCPDSTTCPKPPICPETISTSCPIPPICPTCKFYMLGITSNDKNLYTLDENYVQLKKVNFNIDYKFNYIYPLTYDYYLAINDKNYICIIDNLNVKLLETYKDDSDNGTYFEVQTVIPAIKGYGFNKFKYIGINKDNILYTIDDFGIYKETKISTLIHIIENPYSNSGDNAYIGIDINNKLCVVNINLENIGNFEPKLLEKELDTYTTNYNYDNFKFKNIFKSNNNKGLFVLGVDGEMCRLSNFADKFSINDIGSPVLANNFIQLKNNNFIILSKNNLLFKITDGFTSLEPLFDKKFESIAAIF